ASVHAVARHRLGFPVGDIPVHRILSHRHFDGERIERRRRCHSPPVRQLDGNAHPGVLQDSPALLTSFPLQRHEDQHDARHHPRDRGRVHHLAPRPGLHHLVCRIAIRDGDRDGGVAGALYRRSGALRTGGAHGADHHEAIRRMSISAADRDGAGERMMTLATYEYAALRNFAAALGERAGLPADRAKVQAEILLEADLMGHTTHGLAMLPGFLKSIESGAIRAKGEPEIIFDRGSTMLWDARTLPGTWIVSRAISEGAGRAADHGVATIVIRNTAHIAALGAYLRQATAQGFIILIANSDPSMRTVAPAGSREAQLAPNPLAFGYPTED